MIKPPQHYFAVQLNWKPTKKKWLLTNRWDRKAKGIQMLYAQKERLFKRRRPMKDLTLNGEGPVFAQRLKNNCYWVHSYQRSGPHVHGRYPILCVRTAILLHAKDMKRISLASYALQLLWRYACSLQLRQMAMRQSKCRARQLRLKGVGQRYIRGDALTPPDKR